MHPVLHYARTCLHLGETGAYAVYVQSIDLEYKSNITRPTTLTNNAASTWQMCRIHTRLAVGSGKLLQPPVH